MPERGRFRRFGGAGPALVFLRADYVGTPRSFLRALRRLALLLLMLYLAIYFLQVPFRRAPAPADFHPRFGYRRDRD